MALRVIFSLSEPGKSGIVVCHLELSPTEAQP
jgi:hypothetical protein